MQVKRRLLGVVLAAAFVSGAPIAAPVHADTTRAVLAAKSCGNGYTHGVIGGYHKCLRRGQFCARRRHRQYHRYDFHCHRSSEDSRGNYHLT